MNFIDSSPDLSGEGGSAPKDIELQMRQPTGSYISSAYSADNNGGSLSSKYYTNNGADNNKMTAGNYDAMRDHYSPMKHHEDPNESIEPP